MTDFVPNLDDVSFDQLVERARADIPRYAPDWTDHNLHDPGMTLIDLLAWIVDQQVYRAGSVGGRYRGAFAALLGRRPDAPAPARGLIWPDRTPAAGRQLTARTAVVCPRRPELAVSLDADRLFLPPVTLTGVRGADGTEAPLDGGSWVTGAGLTLSFDGPLGADDGGAPVALGFDVVPPPGAPLTPADPPWGPVVYRYRVGSAGWSEPNVLRDDTSGLARTGIVLLAIPRHTGAPAGSELWLSFHRGFFPAPPQLRAVAVNVLPVVQVSREAAAAFDRPGTGQPDQTAELDTADLLDPPDIRVGGERWERRPDLVRSGPADQHFLVGPDGIRFGNGVNGMRPPTGAVIEHAELARTEGAAGNLRAGLPWTVPVLGADPYGRNRQALTGGQDAGGDLAAAAREVAVERSALLTDQELVDGAAALPGLALRRAEAIAGFDRRLPDRRVDGVRTLVVVADRPGGPRNLPAVVAARLEPRRVLGERLIVEEAVVLTVHLRLTLTVEPGSLDVAAAVRARLSDRLSIGAWPLGRELTEADVTAVAAAVPGVVDVSSVRMATDGEALGDGPVRPPRDGLIVAGRIELETGR